MLHVTEHKLWAQSFILHVPFYSCLISYLQVQTMDLLFKRNLLRKESICSYTPWKQHLIIYETTSFFSLFFFFFWIQSFDRAKKKIIILPSFYFGFIVILLVLSVMLLESTPIKMKLFRVNQRKIDDVYIFYSGPSLKLNEKEIKKKEKETPAVFK